MPFDSLEQIANRNGSPLPGWPMQENHHRLMFTGPSDSNRRVRRVPQKIDARRVEHIAHSATPLTGSESCPIFGSSCRATCAAQTERYCRDEKTADSAPGRRPSCGQTGRIARLDPRWRTFVQGRVHDRPLLRRGRLGYAQHRHERHRVRRTSHADAPGPVGYPERVENFRVVQ